MLGAKEMRGKTSKETPHPVAGGEIMRASIRTTVTGMKNCLKDGSSMEVAMAIAPTDRMKETQGEKRRTKERQ